MTRVIVFLSNCYKPEKKVWCKKIDIFIWVIGGGIFFAFVMTCNLWLTPPRSPRYISDRDRGPLCSEPALNAAAHSGARRGSSETHDPITSPRGSADALVPVSEGWLHSEALRVPAGTVSIHSTPLHLTRPSDRRWCRLFVDRYMMQRPVLSAPARLWRTGRRSVRVDVCFCCICLVGSPSTPGSLRGARPWEVSSEHGQLRYSSELVHGSREGWRDHGIIDTVALFLLTFPVKSLQNLLYLSWLIPSGLWVINKSVTFSTSILCGNWLKLWENVSIFVTFCLNHSSVRWTLKSSNCLFVFKY